MSQRGRAGVEHEVSRQVEAAAGVVWQVMIDVERWPEWTDSVTAVRRLDDGPFGLGSQVRIKQPGLPATVWRVTDFQRHKSFTWFTHSPGVRTFGFHRLVAESDGGVTVRLGIEQRGLLAPLAGMFLTGLTRRHVETEARSLKRRCERR
ncbi:polyketide cyclase [Amycolatopsis antarctica]|uniref:Polyketide cyclase n=1 Tax=Amycolatopsis antarctica TaxID=1854586 RepID=A0A263D2K9_9PSEU|nr:SRPBCC family protein [Amycolatopsis antarctica]OZM71867.1 polyketide cyclase [Amycolatopsis antarctica]